MTERAFVRGGARAALLRPVGSAPGRALRVGVSGGVGAGKSTVTGALRDRGAAVADADELARAVVEPGTPGLEQVVDAFGPRVLAADGSLDRRALAGLVFADDAARERLEGIVHPLVARAAWDLLDGAPAGGLAVYDLPLLVETHAEGLFDAVVMVDAPLEDRLARLEARGMARADARRRIASQAGPEQRRAAATIWIDNAGTPEDLRAVVDRAADAWLR